MASEQAIFNGDHVTLELSRLNVVFNKTHGESDYPERFVIDSDIASQHHDMIEDVCAAAAVLFRMIVTDFDGPVTKARLATCQPCFRRLAGMLDLTVRLMLAHVPFVWKYPEDGLHPMYQGNIADVAIALSTPEGLRHLASRGGKS